LPPADVSEFVEALGSKSVDPPKLPVAVTLPDESRTSDRTNSLDVPLKALAHPYAPVESSLRTNASWDPAEVKVEEPPALGSKSAVPRKKPPR
jgi:hypothetical protein